MKKKQKDITTQEFIDIYKIDDKGIITALKKSRVVFLIIEPVNIGVLSETAVAERVYGLQSVLQAALNKNDSVSDFSVMTVDSTQSYENNKEHLQALAETESIESIKKLDKKDVDFLDEVHLTMATNRDFLIVLKFKHNATVQQQDMYINRVYQILNEHSFSCSLADKAHIKRLLAVYYAQVNFEDELPDYDGMQFLQKGEQDLNEEK